jgi:hypothetical protein
LPIPINMRYRMPLDLQIEWSVCCSLVERYVVWQESDEHT